MARGKKVEQVLTLEEKLKQALVPEDEQPYSIPENWCWTIVDKVSTVVTGGTPSKKNPEYYGDDFPFFKPSDLDAGRHVFKASEYLSRLGMNVARVIPKESTAVCCIGTIGKCGYLEIEGTTNQQINSAIPNFNSLFLYYFLNTNIFLNQLWSKSSATTISIVNKTKMESCYFPLAPLAEQQRIVDRIERLFSKLDEAKEKVQAVVDGFELRKSAILHKAFTGELTVQWRKTSEVELESWESVQWGDLITSIKAGKNWLAEGHPPNNDEFGVVKVSAVTWGEFDEQESKTCTTPSQWNEAVQIKTGDFLFSRANTLQLVGNCVIVEDISKRLMLSDKILKLTFSEKVIPWFVLYFTNSKLYRVQIEDLSSGNQDGMRNVSQKNLKLVELLLPRLQEQKEIVRILDNFFAKEKQAKQVAESVLTQIDYIKKSILSRAFRGELGTNDPAEESAEELLKTVL